MAGQVVSRRTVYGWLMILASLAVLEDADQGPLELAQTVSFPVAVVDLLRRSIFVMSPGMRRLLGLRREDVRGTDLHELVEKSENLTTLVDLLMEGSIDAYQVLRPLHRSDGGAVEAYNWVAVCERHQRHRALWVASPVGDDTELYPSRPAPAEWPDHVAGLVVGTLDAQWRIERVSVDLGSLLGYSPEEVAGVPFVSIVHADDVPALLNAAAHAIVDQAGVAAELRIRHRTGEWIHAHAVVTPLAGALLRFGFVLATPSPAPSVTAGRVADLERRLWRIAREIEASGIAAGFDAVAEPASLPGLAELSPRQWEVLTRLLRGERVPTIASQMYISASTVRNHLAYIFRKYGVHSQDELLRLLRAQARERRDAPPDAS